MKKPHLNWPRIIRPAMHAVFYFGIVLLVLAGGLYAYLQTDAANEYIRRRLVSLLEGTTRARFVIGQLTGNLLTGATLKNAAIYNPESDVPLFAFETIRVSYALPLLITGKLYIPTVEVDGFSSYLAAGPDNRWNTAALLPPERNTEPGEPEIPGKPFKLVIGEVTVKNAELGLAWYAGGEKQELIFKDGNCRTRLTIGACIENDIRHLSFQMPWPGVTFEKITGGVDFDIPSKRLGFDAAHFRTSSLSDLIVDGGISFAGGPRFDLGADIAAISAEEIGRLFSIPARRATASGRLEVTGTIDALAHRLELEHGRTSLDAKGTIDFSGPDALVLQTGGTVTHYDPASSPFCPVDGLKGDISAAFLVRAEQLLCPKNRHIDIDVSAVSSELSGYALDKAQIQASCSAEDTEITQFALTAPCGAVQAHGRIGRLFDTGAEKPFEINAEIADLDPGAFPGLEDFCGALNLDLDIRGSLDRSLQTAKSDIELTARVHPSKLKGFENLAGKIDLSWLKQRLTVRQVALTSDNGMVDATGSLDFKDDSCRLGFRASAGDLGAIFDLMPGDFPGGGSVAGAADLKGQISGIWYRPDFRVQGELRNTNLREFSAERAILDARGTLAPEGMHASGNLAGSGITINRLTVSALDARWRLSPDRLVIEGEASADGNRAVLSGAVAGWRTPEKTVTVDTFQLSGGSLPPLVNTQPASARILGNRVRVDRLHLRSDEATLSAAGSIDLAPDGGLASHIRIENLDLQRLAELLPGIQQVQGTLSGEVRLSNTLAEPLVETTGSLVNCGWHGILLSRLDAAADFSAGRFKFSARGFRDDSQVLVARGELPGRLSLYPLACTPVKDGFAAEIAASGFRLSEFDLPYGEDYTADGTIYLQARLAGDPGAPAISGTLSVKEATLALDDYALTYETGEAEIDFLENTLILREIRIGGDKEGQLQASGRISYNSAFKPESFNIRMTGTGFQIPFRNAVFIRTEPELELRGTPDAPELTGRITASGGRVFLDRLMKQQPAEIEVIEPVEETDGTYLLPDTPTSLGFLEPLAADILVEIKEGVWIKGKEENLEIAGRIRLDKAHGGGVKLHGSLHSVRGTYLFRNRLFKITTGEIRFLGLEEIDPNVNIEARSRQQDVTIIIRLTGTFRNLQLTLDSQPHMQTIDIISYMMFGRPSDELSQGESYRAEDAALSITGQLAADQLKAILGDSFRLDLIHISTGNGDISKGAVSVGKYIAPNVFVTYNQGFTQEVPRSVEVDYEITRHFSLSAQVDEERTSAVDLVWKHDYSGFLELLFGED